MVLWSGQAVLSAGLQWVSARQVRWQCPWQANNHCSCIIFSLSLAIWWWWWFHSRKCNWKCRLRKWQPFCPGGDEIKVYSSLGNSWSLIFGTLGINDLSEYDLVMQQINTRAHFNMKTVFPGKVISIIKTRGFNSLAPVILNTSYEIALIWTPSEPYWW